MLLKYWEQVLPLVFFLEYQPECQFMHVSFLILYASCMWILKIRWYFCCLYVKMCASLQKSYMHTILNVNQKGKLWSFIWIILSFWMSPKSELVLWSIVWISLSFCSILNVAEFVLVESIYFRSMTPKSSEIGKYS